MAGWLVGRSFVYSDTHAPTRTLLLHGKYYNKYIQMFYASLVRQTDGMLVATLTILKAGGNETSKENMSITSGPKRTAAAKTNA